MVRPVAFSRSSSALVIALLVSSLSPAALADVSRDRAAARTAADAGADAFEQGNYQQALELFSRAEALVHAPPHLLFIARSQDKLGKLVDAHETYLRLVGERLPPGAPAAFKSAQSKAEAELTAIEARLAYVTLSVRGDEGNRAVVNMDSAELPSAMVGIPIPVDPGTHVFSARTDRARSSEVTVTLREGARQAVELSLTEAIAAPATTGAPEQPAGSTPQPQDGTPATPPSSGGSSSQSLWGWVSIGAGAVVAGIGTGFLVSSSGTRKDADDLYAECNATLEGCSDDQQENINAIDSDADTARAVGITGLAVGGAAIVTGVVLILTDRPSNPGYGHVKPAEPRFRLLAGPTWIGARGTF
jgi:hypothetical protein